MKILVYNNAKQYALSRKQIEIVKETLPNEYFAPIREFHLLDNAPGLEMFEYNNNEKIAYFGYEIEQKTNEIISDALDHLLIGLFRIKDKDTFGYLIKESQRSEYLEQIKNWKTKCLIEFERLKNKNV